MRSGRSAGMAPSCVAPPPPLWRASSLGLPDLWPTDAPRTGSGSSRRRLRLAQAHDHRLLGGGPSWVPPGRMPLPPAAHRSPGRGRPARPPDRISGPAADHPIRRDDRHRPRARHPTSRRVRGRPISCAVGCPVGSAPGTPTSRPALGLLGAGARLRQAPASAPWAGRAGHDRLDHLPGVHSLPHTTPAGVAVLGPPGPSSADQVERTTTTRGCCRAPRVSEAPGRARPSAPSGPCRHAADCVQHPAASGRATSGCLPVISSLGCTRDPAPAWRGPRGRARLARRPCRQRRRAVTGPSTSVRAACGQTGRSLGTARGSVRPPAPAAHVGVPRGTRCDHTTVHRAGGPAGVRTADAWRGSRCGGGSARGTPAPHTSRRGGRTRRRSWSNEQVRGPAPPALPRATVCPPRRQGARTRPGAHRCGGGEQRTLR